MRAVKLRKYDTKENIVIFKKSKGRFFQKLKKRESKKNIRISGFKKRVKKLKQRDDYFDDIEKDRIWDRICKKGLKEKRDFLRFGRKLRDIRERNLHNRGRLSHSLGYKDSEVALEEDMDQ